MVVISLLSFLILFIWVFSLFFLLSLAGGLPILFIFSKNQILVLLIFSTVFFNTTQREIAKAVARWHLS